MFEALKMERKGSLRQMSLCEKLEVKIGNYYLYGVCNSDIETLYYDGSVGVYDYVKPVKENMVAFFLKNESIAIVRKDMLTKLKHDTEEFDITFIVVESLFEEVVRKEDVLLLSDYIKYVTWIDDDFMNDAGIEFDFAAFEVIDSGVNYLNPKHFSIEHLISIISAEGL